MGRTKEEIKEYKRQWYLNNKDRILKERKKYYDENKDQINAERKEYFQKYRETHRNERHKYNKENKNKIDEYNHQYYLEHIDEIREWGLVYREENKEKLQETSRQYRERNKKNLSEKRKQPAKYDQFYDKISPYYDEDEIQRDPDNPELIQVRCQNQNCRKWFNPAVNQLYNRLHSIYGIDGGSNYMYCSDECKKSCVVFGQREFPRGFLKTKANLENNREMPPGLREMVLERDNYTCQKCGKSKADFPELKLHCHHIKPINEEPIFEADKDNCITLCEDCHKWIHCNIDGCGYRELQCTKKTKNTSEDAKDTK